MQTLLLECGERDVLGVGAFEMERVLVFIWTSEERDRQRERGVPVEMLTPRDLTC
jgi:hypothetical protein